MKVWRINLKPASKIGVDARAHCLTKGLVGFGWPVDFGNEAMTADNYQKKGMECYDIQGGGWWFAWNSFNYNVVIDDLIWTRDLNGIYYLGRICGEWFYDNSNDAIQADIVNVRKCEWHTVGTIESVPGKLVNCFIPSKTVQTVKDDAVNTFSQLTYNEKAGSNYYHPEILTTKDLYSLLSSEDCEDVLAIYLQVTKNYMVIPSSCKKDTVGYEYVLINRATGRKAVVQVKNGFDNLDNDQYHQIGETVYLFTTKGKYLGRQYDDIYCINPEEIRQFIFDNINLMPKRIKIWLEFILTNGFGNIK